MRTQITPGQTCDYLGFDLVMTDNLPAPTALLAGRGYAADSIRKKMQAREVLPQISMRNPRNMRIGVDRSLYSLRNPVERWFNKLQNADRASFRCARRILCTSHSALGKTQRTRSSRRNEPRSIQ